MCATALEAPELSSAATEPVEVTTCAAVETTSELMERRLYTWTAPYERGVDLVHQITDLFEIAVAGEGYPGDGSWIPRSDHHLGCRGDQLHHRALLGSRAQHCH